MGSTLQRWRDSASPVTATGWSAAAGQVQFPKPRTQLPAGNTGGQWPCRAPAGPEDPQGHPPGLGRRWSLWNAGCMEYQAETWVKWWRLWRPVLGVDGVLLWRWGEGAWRAGPGEGHLRRGKHKVRKSQSTHRPRGRAHAGAGPERTGTWRGLCPDSPCRPHRGRGGRATEVALS